MHLHDTTLFYLARHNGSDKKCKDSCKSVLKSREHDLATSNLASSALDAIFSLHEHEGDDDDEEGNRDSTTRPSRRYQQEASATDDEESTRTRTLNNSEKVRNNDTTMNNNGIHQNLGHRPKRLPHLIDTLVGNIDGHVDKKRNRPRVIHYERKRTKNSGEMEMVRQNIKNHAGDSVARVAAAAAAAVISESELSSRWGSSRMKSQNDEWEEALKWISTWGPQNQDDSSSRDAASQSNQKQNRNRNDNERQVNYSHNQRGEEQGREGMKWRRKKAGESSSNLDELFEVCVEQCLGDNEREWMLDSDPTSSGVISSIKTYMGSPVINGLLSYFGFPDISISSRYSSTAVRQGIRNIFATMLSAAVLWFLQSVYGWWTLSKYTTSLEILLQEESKNEGKEAHGKRSGKRRTGRKKSKQRKNKGHHRSVRPDNHVHQSKATDDMNWNPSEDDDSDSDDSFDRIYLMRSGTKHASTYAVDSHSDQASKGTISTASWTTFDSGRIQSSDPNFNPAQDPTGNHQSDKSLLECKPNEFDPRGRWTSINLEKSPVPTDAQREQEYQKLRIFQETQLQKLIENRKKAKALNKAEEKKMIVKDQDFTPKKTSVPLINGNEKALPHPPGLSPNITSGSGKVKKSFTEAVTGEYPVEANAVDLLLSNLLDEGEEEEVSVSLSVKKRSEVTSNTDLDQNRSIALGDLLLGSIGSGESPSRGSPSLTIANPWQNQPRNYTGFDTNSGFSLGVPEEVPRSASSDANVQLQVSATEFMPQWGEGNQASVNTRIW